MFVSKHRAMPKAKPNRWDSSSIVLHAGGGSHMHDLEAGL